MVSEKIQVPKCAVCAKCGLPIMLVPSHSPLDCEIEGETWWHDAESVPDGIDPCDAYDANDDHEGVSQRHDWVIGWIDGVTRCRRCDSVKLAYSGQPPTPSDGGIGPADTDVVA